MKVIVLVRRSFIAFASAAAVSCGGAERSDVQPVRGTCLAAGRPAVGARVVLVPVAAGRGSPASGVAGSDGTFRLTTVTKDDGAKEGEYAVTITWPDPQRANGDGTGEAADRLRGAYRDPAKPFCRVTVRPGENELPPFEIK
ncbi:hypothetical protein GobsT_16480 [Gemmata obscuriglobus]|uniref:Carboxypeptidase regulatory-like domain-containing protein n=1 Tax=Gemmata obscuriglobus TaxID=114 RepID=A0A2Z3H8N8_9BACT|nr:hypothetical protein [Gemmata obscuriglobus]AWM39956.1 hypothetical protein C1280_25085 [Gemmata obscuriglobus]QEG26900.1 hypothetical protein GobsT_16480 [Gemmata obscuriglobus]VTS02991.1 Uncharacterized protein OS=Singulisphaera acidiphila (strain ATCC BAA-1392 / DSM 18658 / VKM B-2454 / MOB10) GN=Sinac_3752 PE=4 SV=1 [Gemmata obscuriglobus UQM 2246]